MELMPRAYQSKRTYSVLPKEYSATDSTLPDCNLGNYALGGFSCDWTPSSSPASAQSSRCLRVGRSLAGIEGEREGHLKRWAHHSFLNERGFGVASADLLDGVGVGTGVTS